jgi:hypothetical protein
VGVKLLSGESRGVKFSFTVSRYIIICEIEPDN